ncbi:MAG TPA: flagellar FlbD family protein [Syntrophomonadaceae bacterium]|nr:flagellar FlbD family protein [Syntrophomonadaceae bacterium]
MIYVTRLNGEKIAVNVDLIEIMEETPDTIVTLTTGKKFVVKEAVGEIIKAITRYRKTINTTLKK